MHPQTQQAIFPDFYDAFGTGEESHDKRMSNRFKLRRDRYAENQRNVCGLHTAICKIDRCWSFRCSRHAEEHHVRLLELVSMLPVVMHHGIIEGIDPLEILCIQNVLSAH